VLVAVDPSVPTFDASVTAGFYSQLAGVLAGFAFTGLILLITARLSVPAGSSPTTPTRHFSAATRVLVVSFIGLVLASLNYAVLAGDTSKSRAAAALQLISGLGFGAAGLFLVYAVSLTLDAVDKATPATHADLEDAYRFLNSLLVTVIVPLILLFIYLGVQDFKIADSDTGFDVIDGLSCGLVATQLIAGVMFTGWYSLHGGLSGAVRDRAIRTSARICVGLMLGIAATFAILATFLQNQGYLDAVPFVVMSCGFLASMAFAFHVARTSY
jgi:hypothetical protein